MNFWAQEPLWKLEKMAQFHWCFSLDLRNGLCAKKHVCFFQLDHFTQNTLLPLLSTLALYILRVP